MDFVNESKEVSHSTKEYYTGNCYTFNKPSKYLFVWSRLFQTVISQAGTYLLTGKFHTQQAAIYKCEGGCVIAGVGELVLSNHSCYFDTYSRDKKTKVATEKMAMLISHIVLNWKPSDPVDSILHLASEFAGTTVPDLRAAIEKAGSSSSPFGGNALADFFDWNPFSDSPIDREYEKWCRVTISKEDPDKVDQSHCDIDLGKEYRKRINDHIKKANPNDWTTALCCSPRRDKEGKLIFWINTGRQTNIDGWKTEQDIQNFLKSDGKIIDTSKW
jgi:hypothetical protein